MERVARPDAAGGAAAAAAIGGGAVPGRRPQAAAGEAGDDRLWQIGGRADLPWEESVRLDLFYVENWSVVIDLAVLWKTLAVVAHGRGGY